MSNSRPGYHQDYIARIRYTNALPPPPFAPKLLEIANSGSSSGQYTSAAFASRLAREQPLNIEADAELGMKIDLVGIPGVFDGNNSAILFLENPGPIDPRDRALLRPLTSLGKSSAAPTNVSFLRRTEYITAHKTDGTGGGRTSSALLPSKRVNVAAKPPPAPEKKQDKNTEIANMCRTIEKSFNLAYPKDAYTGPDTLQNIRAAEISRDERNAWNNPKHPTRSDLKLLDSYPIIPDIAALGESGSFFLVKFNTNPGATETYDPKLSTMVLIAKEPSAEDGATYTAEMEKHTADPIRYPHVPQLFGEYCAYLPEGDANIVVPRIKRKFDLYANDNDADDLYTHPGDVKSDEEQVAPYFKYNKLRPYETYQQQGDNLDDNYKWNGEIGIALHDADAPHSGTGPKRQTAAYIYPINQKTFIRPKRPKTRGTMGMSSQHMKGEVEDDSAEILELRITAPDEELREAAAQQRIKLDPDWAE